MSKRNMLLGLAAGKVGDLVFYRDGGEQRTRTRVIPKNPRSPRQMAQRVKLANVVNTFRQLQSILRDSFTGRPSNQSGYNAFAKNAISISPYMRKASAMQGSVTPCPYAISRGTLDGVSYAVRDEEILKGLALSVPNLTAEGATVASISSALIAAYPFLMNGDELHFVLMDFFVSDLPDGAEATFANTKIASLVIDTSSELALSAAGVVVEDDALYMASSSEDAIFQGAVLVSRVDGNGQLQVSTAQLLLSAGAEDVYSSFLSQASLDVAIASYGVGEQSILRD